MSFGRKGLEGVEFGAPRDMGSRRTGYVGAMPDALAADEDIVFEGASIDWSKRKGWIIAAVVTPLVVLTLDVMFAGTTMITPIDPDLVYWATALCAAVGFAVGVLIFLTWENGPKGVRTFIGLFLGLPMLTGAWGFGTVWRVADHIAFDTSGAVWERAQYPITSLNWPRRRGPGERATLSINPFDAGPARIPIPDYQFTVLDGDYEGQCVTVEQRRNAAGAIEIRTNGTFTASEPERADIAPC